MKKLLGIMSSLVVVACLVLQNAGCYDDSQLVSRLDDYGARLQALEKLCAEMNTNISSLQQIVTALQNNDFVTDIVPIVENGKEIGYTLTFSKSGPVTIYHGRDGKDGKDGADGKDGKDGKDGVDGQDGSTPVIGIQQDTDGNWYWTLNGEWLLDDQGDKVRASANDGKDGEDGQDGSNGKDGANGVTPQLKIMNEYWYISYDNGKNWKRLGKATGADGKDGIDGIDGKDGRDGRDGRDGTDGKDGKDGKDGTDGTSFFKSVVVENDSIVLTLSDNTVITIPKALPLSISLSDGLYNPPRYDFNTKDTIEVVIQQQMFVIKYKVTSAADTVVVEAVGSPDLSVLIRRKSMLEGEIVVQTPQSDVNAFTRLTILASDDKSILLRSFSFIKKYSD